MTFKYNPIYSEEQEALIRSEFVRLKDECYLEHTGTTFYSERQIQNALSELTLNTYGNPHASNTSSKLTDDAIDQIRYLILEHFNSQLSEYSVIFTSGSTASLKLVAECFQYGSCGTFVYLQDNHTSVLGMREYAKNILPLSTKDAFSAFSEEKPDYKDNSNSNSLFVYPAQSNFAGTKYPLAWIDKIQRGILNNHTQVGASAKWFCMLDAASYASTSFLDLSKYKPDFVCISFYKLFGYPTGLGALLVKNSSGYVLKKKYFGGGTVLMALSSEQKHVPLKILHKYMEDGTVSFLSIMAVKHGFDTLKRFSLDMKTISKHTFNLARYVYENLKVLRHQTGEAVAVLYTDGDFDDVDEQGGIVNFNLLRSNGEFVGYAEVLHIANLFNIHLRTGCFCNPGACHHHLKLTSEDVKHHFRSGHVCGDKYDLIDGQPTGSVRISFGYMSNKKDADTFLKMIEDCFVSKVGGPTCKFNFKSKHNASTKPKECMLKRCKRGVLEKILLYPVKSCGAFNPDVSWEIINTGFKYDRQWMIVNSAGVCVTQKNDTRLCLIKPKINVERDTLELHYKGFTKVMLSLHTTSNDINQISSLKCQSKVCGDQVQGWDCGNEVASWLSKVLDTPGLRLLKQCNDPNDINRNSIEGTPLLSLANQAQFLLINTASVQWLSDYISNDFNVQDLIDRFRPNLVVKFHEALVENNCKNLQIGSLMFNCDGLCTRCQMVCIDQSTGEKSTEPLKSLSQLFNGKIRFGIYLSHLNVKKQYFLHLNENVVLYM